jgi:hypothetical protein
MQFDDDDRDLDFDDRIDPTRRKKNKSYRPEDDDGRGGKKHYDREREKQRIRRDWGDYEDDDQE